MQFRFLLQSLNPDHYVTANLIGGYFKILPRHLPPESNEMIAHSNSIKLLIMEYADWLENRQIQKEGKTEQTHEKEEKVILQAGPYVMGDWVHVSDGWEVISNITVMEFKPSYYKITINGRVLGGIMGHRPVDGPFKEGDLVISKSHKTSHLVSKAKHYNVSFRISNVGRDG